MIETCNAKCGNCFSVDRETEPGGRAGVGRGWGSEARVGEAGGHTGIRVAVAREEERGPHPPPDVVGHLLLFSLL